MKHVRCSAESADSAEILAGRIARSGIPVFSIDLEAQILSKPSEPMSFQKGLMCNFFGEGTFKSSTPNESYSGVVVTVPDEYAHAVEQIMMSSGGYSIKTR